MKYLLPIFGFLLITVSATAQAPTANFSANITEGCSPLVVSFKDESSGGVTSWYWDFGNGATSTLQNPSTSYFDPGSYTITLKVTNASGTHTTTKSGYITVYAPPVVNFTAPVTTGCTPTEIQFYDQSTTGSGTIITGWSWNFGDGSTSVLKDPTHTYKYPGNYSVSLTIRTNKGCEKTLTKPYYINATNGVLPVFDFTDPDVCSAPATVTFNNKSTGPGTLSYSWDFGNGIQSTATNPSVNYSTNGTYKVLLYVTSDQGCTDSISSTVIVGKANTDFTVPANICPGQPVQFINNSNPRPISAKWRFSNGTTDTLKNGVTIFDAPGTYQVTLINTYTACTDSITKTITTSPVPTAAFSVSDTGKCTAPLTVTFTNSSNGTAYTWDFGDSTAKSNATSPSHTYTKEGDFTVTLIATNANGCSDTLTKPVLIQVRKPKISFPKLPAQGCLPLKVDFLANIIAADSVMSYSWDFGNGATSTQKTPTYTYNTEGIYDITLTITTSTGCTETLKLQEGVKVGTKPFASFTSDVTNACADPGIQFTNLSTNATSYMWEFSDGSKSNLKDPRQTFMDTGWIDVRLIAINNGCEDDTIMLKYAYIKPTVSRFDYQPDCSNPLSITFTDRSIGATTWIWNFGDGSADYTGQNPPKHTFPANGSYTISLTTSDGSCSYTGKRTITIKDLKPDFTAVPQEGCKPMNAVFYHTSPDKSAMSGYVWDFGDGTGSVPGDANYASHLYLNPGVYSVTLTTIDSFGCSYSTTKTSYVKVNGSLANFTSATNAGCKGMTTSFTDGSTTSPGNSIVKWTFDFGDSTVQTFTAPPFQHQYDSVGDYDVKLIVEDASGCKDSVIKREFVKVSSAKADYSIDGPSCPGSPVFFSNFSKSDLPLTYDWSFGDGLSSDEKNPAHSYADTGLYTVKLRVTDAVGCSDSAVFVDYVHIALPKADFTANNFISYCTPFEAKFINQTYFLKSSSWDLANATSNAKDPANYYTATGQYKITLYATSPGGCRDSISKYLDIYDPNDATIDYDSATGCRPKTVNFSAFKPMNATFIWDFGDGNVIDTTSNVISHVYENFGNFIPKVILKQPEGCVVPVTGSETVKIYGAKVQFGVDRYLFCDTGTPNIIDTTVYAGSITKYSWDFGDGTQSNQPLPSHTYVTPGSYNIKLTVESEGGCLDSMTLAQPVKIVQSPDIVLSGDVEICTNERVQLSAALSRPDTSNISWQWQFPNGQTYTSQNPPLQSYPPGTYQVSVIATNSSGCFDNASTTLQVHSLPNITMPESITKQVGVPITIPAQYSSGTRSYYWSPGNSLDCNSCPQPVSSTKFNTDYTVSILDSNGCADQDTIRVVVVCEGATIFFPNAFSPNGDGSNDVFIVRGNGLDRVKSIRMFNRWGEVVYERKDFPVNNASYGWDGKVKGGKPQPGVYIYQAEVFCENGEVIRFEGNVALIQ